MHTHKQKIRISQMAQRMREIGDGCRAEHLILKGFTRQEIETLGPAATEEANATSIRAA